MAVSLNPPSLDNSYSAIPVAALPAGQRLDFDLYLPIDGHFVLYASAGSFFELKTPLKQRDKEIRTLFARLEDKGPLRYYEANMSRILKDDNIEIKARSQIYYAVATNQVKEILDDPRSGTAIKRSKETVRNLVEMILTQNEAFFNLMRITSHDYYTYTHSVNVCTLAVGLATRLGMTSPTAITALGLGALLHDVGKCSIDLKILNKPAALSEAEWQVMRKHPEWGAKLMREPAVSGDPQKTASGEESASTLPRTEVPADAFQAIEQHHEACNGRGYPHGLSAKEIHLYGKVVKIADIYDAMTTNRCYQKACTPYQAIRRMAEAHADTIDRNIFREFVLLLGFGAKR